MVEISDEQIETLKNKGLTCSKLKGRINKEMGDARKARADAEMYRNLGINSQAEMQTRIAEAEEKSADFLRTIKKRLCPLR